VRLALYRARMGRPVRRGAALTRQAGRGNPAGGLARWRLDHRRHRAAHRTCSASARTSAEQVRRGVIEHPLGQRVDGGVQVPVGGRQAAEQPVPAGQRRAGQDKAFHEVPPGW